MGILSSRQNAFTLVSLGIDIDRSYIDIIRDYLETNRSAPEVISDDQEYIFKFSYLFTDHVEQEYTAVKSKKIIFWLLSGADVCACFTDKRSILLETINVLRSALNVKVERKTLNHEFLLLIAKDRFVCNDVIGIKLESEGTGFLKSVSMDGQNIHQSEEFMQLLEKNHKITKLVMNVNSVNGETFVATLHKSGHILLSPYSSINDVKFFIKYLTEKLRYSHE